MRPFLFFLLLASPLPQDEEIVEEFRRYFRRFSDTATRVEAILALEGAESPGVVEVLVPLLDDDDPQVVDAAARVLGGFEDPAPIQRLVGELEQASGSDEVRWLLRAVARGGYAQGEQAVRERLEESDWEVRVAAIRALVALAVAPGAGAVPDEGEAQPPVDEAIAALWNDREVAVRVAVLDALAELGSQRVLPLAREGLDHDAWQVRASAIAALARVRDKGSIEPLIERLAAEEGRLVQDVADALTAIAGRDFGRDVGLWRRFWDTLGERFEIPTDEEIAKLRAAQEEAAARYGTAEDGVRYHGVETTSERIVFVIDVSGSMEQEVVDRERFPLERYPDRSRLGVVKRELTEAVRSLPAEAEFDILAFATEVRPWKGRLVRANPLNRSSAESFIERLEPLGAPSRGEALQAAGLSGAANLEAGKTNTYAALMRALGVDPDKGAGEGYEVDVDTVFFLSDGRPSAGAVVSTDDILNEVAEANALRKVVIHTIAIGEFEKEFMSRLAQESGGTFVDLGW